MKKSGNGKVKLTLAAIGAAPLGALGISACQQPRPSGVPVVPAVLAAMDGHPLYMGHCAPCHGPAGAGDGPAAIALTVAPRDFWHEPFRYVSTLNSVPSDDDLAQSIRFGRLVGEMPAGPQLTDSELRALAAYVREIRRLGLLDELKKEFAEDEDTSIEELEEISHVRVQPRDPIDVTRPGPGFERDLDRGRELYDANCASCHGPTGRGDGLDKPLDARGSPITVRDLTSGEFRGGTEPEEIFKRIRCGVPGTPMSAAIGLTDEEVWQLVHYVRFLVGSK